MNNFVWIESYKTYINIFAITSIDASVPGDYYVKMADGDCYTLDAEEIRLILDWRDN